MPEFIAKLILHAAGEKTSSFIGLALGYLIAAYSDFGTIVPEKYASYVSGALGLLTTVFGAYVVIPGKGRAPSVEPKQ